MIVLKKALNWKESRRIKHYKELPEYFILRIESTIKELKDQGAQSIYLSGSLVKGYYRCPITGTAEEKEFRKTLGHLKDYSDIDFCVLPKKVYKITLEKVDLNVCDKLNRIKLL